MKIRKIKKIKKSLTNDFACGIFALENFDMFGKPVERRRRKTIGPVWVASCNEISDCVAFFIF